MSKSIPESQKETTEPDNEGKVKEQKGDLKQEGKKKEDEQKKDQKLEQNSSNALDKVKRAAITFTGTGTGLAIT